MQAFILCLQQDRRRTCSKIIGNNFVNLSDYVDLTIEDLKLPEKVYYPVLKEILDNNEGEEAIKEALLQNKTSLSPTYNNR